MAGHTCAWLRPGGRGVLCLGYRDEARRHPRARRGLLRHAAALHRVSDAGGLCQAERIDCDSRRADRRRRPDRGEGYDREEVGWAKALFAPCPPLTRVVCCVVGTPSGAHLRDSMALPTLRRLPIFRRQFKSRKIETGRDGASGQRPVAVTFGGLPCLCGHSGLRHFAGGKMGSEYNDALAFAIGNLKRQRTARVIMPDFYRVDAVPVRALAARQQEIDRGRKRASIRIEARVAKSFAKMSALGMRLERKPRDDFGCVRRRIHQDLFLRSRSSPNTSAAPAPFRCTLAATAGSSARKNTFAFFSSPSSVGTVGWPAARSRATSSARAFRSGLFR